ncbi:MAG: helix-turn-helix transcriptional regulator [Rubricella sp.]
MAADSHASRVARAITAIRSDFRSSLSVPDLAGVAGMGVSSFHTHFKSVTGTTPLQFQKDLRLIDARTQLLERNQSVAEAAHCVGYESATQFSRDYSRKFGRSPSQDAKLNRAVA